ncbi:MAG: hypothetical protein WBM53_16210 [Maribacter sp.]
MIRSQKIFLISLTLILVSMSTIAQEKELEVEESAEVFLEEYSDAFQESFFEALKQKGIENYDKAINLLLECKILDANNNVVDHELAKVYLLDKQYILAQEFAISALLSEPTNLWYLNTLVLTLQMQGSSIENKKAKIPYDNNKLKENLALIYFKQNKYQAALNVIADSKKSFFTDELTLKINDSLKNKEDKKTKENVNTLVDNAANPLEELKAQILNLINQNDLSALQQKSEEAMEDYPSQPYFYYAHGYALNKSSKHKEAVEVLETALDYMLDDVPLMNKIYQELVEAHTALNNSSKANMYLRMIKPGF